MPDNQDRREFLTKTALIALSLCPSSLNRPASAAETEEVTPVEDLMREHGLLNRLLLIYDHAAWAITNKQPVEIPAVAEAADIAQCFVGLYHEKLEEDFVFPRFEKANKFTDLVAVLRKQHRAGRQLTSTILLGTASRDFARLAPALSAFTRMYRPHEAREDTVLFPAFQSLVPKKQYMELGAYFEELEHDMFGKAGFEGLVEKVAAIEKRLGIYDLSQFTPRLPL